jgi:nitronate monooxygenase
VTRFTDLVGCRLPIQQAGMGWIAGVDLAVAVAEAGGLGMLAMPMVPPEVLDGLLADIRARTDQPVGVNFLMPFLDPACLDVAAAGARVVECFYADPDAGLVDRVHAGGALACWQVGSVREARAAVDAGCDLLVVQGTEAGGHVRGTSGLAPLLDAVRAAVDLPLVAAGGIATAAHVATALRAGADAVRVGTRFVVAAEADAHPRYVEALLAAGGADTVLTSAFEVGWPDAPHRVLGSAVERAQALAGDVVGEVAVAGRSMPVPRLSPLAPTRAATGAIEAMALYAGQSVGHVQRVQTAAEIVHDLAAGLAAP